MEVGFIGLGQMGSGMAANLIKAGHKLTAYNRTSSRTKPLADRGAVIADTIAGAARQQAVITMLANDRAVEECVFGQSGILANLPPGAVHISASTISVTLSQTLAKAHAEAGQEFIAAPVFGRPEAAAAGKLVVIAAGKPPVVEFAKPLLDALGQKTFVVSDDPGKANLVKLSGNFLIACVIESLGEAFALIAKGGVDKKQYFEILTTTLFASPVYRIYGELLVEGNFEPAGFAAPLGQKDIRLALAAAESLCVPMPIASLLRDRFLTLLAQGGETLDWSAIGNLAAKDAGLVGDH